MIVCTLKQYIESKDLNITALSKQCGVSRPPLIALANGTSKGIQFDTLDKLCRFFNIAPSDLLFRVDEHSISLYTDIPPIELNNSTRTVSSGSISIGAFDISVDILLTVSPDAVDAEIRLSRDAINDEQVMFITDVIDAHPDLEQLVHHSVEKQAEQQIIDNLLSEKEIFISATLLL